MSEYKKFGYTAKRAVKGDLLTDLGAANPDKEVFV